MQMRKCLHIRLELTGGIVSGKVYVNCKQFFSAGFVVDEIHGEDWAEQIMIGGI